jgi:hypothetical protein
MKPHHLIAFGRLLCFLSVPLLASCTITHNVSRTQYTDYMSEEKVHLKIALNLTDELRKTKYDFHELGETDIWPIGTLLADNVPLLARHTFMEVVEIENSSQPSKPVDAVLTLKVPYLGEKVGGSTFSKGCFSMKFEWTLVDPNGDVIWADTVNGEVRSGSWSLGSIIKLTMEQALRKSQYAMLTSKTIQQFVMKKYPGVQITITTNRIVDPDVMELCTSLHSTNRAELLDTIKILRTMNAPEAVPGLQSCLKNPDPAVVREACRTLAVLGNKDTIPYIEPLLNDPRGAVRKDAQKAIDTLRSKSQ